MHHLDIYFFLRNKNHPGIGKVFLQITIQTVSYLIIKARSGSKLQSLIIMGRNWDRDSIVSFYSCFILVCYQSKMPKGLTTFEACSSLSTNAPFSRVQLYMGQGRFMRFGNRIEVFIWKHGLFEAGTR